MDKLLREEWDAFLEWTKREPKYSRRTRVNVSLLGILLSYMAISITILTIQSYPMVGGLWTVEFETTGISTLKVTPFNGTEWGTDLVFQGVYCGDTQVNTVRINNSYVVNLWSCAEKGREVSKVISHGKHHLMFEFGSEVAFAHNDAGNSSNTSNIISSAHVIDSSNPLDGVGDGVGGLGDYMFVGDRIGAPNDNKYRGYLIFRNITSNCSLGIHEANLYIYHYVVTGDITELNVSLMNQTAATLANGDYEKVAKDIDFFQLNVSEATGANDQWWTIPISTQLNDSIFGNYSHIGFRFDPQWYEDDGAVDAIYIQTSTSEYNAYINYTCYTPDVTAPIITISYPTNNSALAHNTPHSLVNITTDGNANCRYNLTNSTFNYTDGGVDFTTTGTTIHSRNYTGLKNNTWYNLYYKCNDSAGNINPTSTHHRFGVSANATITTYQSLRVMKLNNTLTNSTIINVSVAGDTINVTLSWTNWTYFVADANVTNWTITNSNKSVNIILTRTGQENKSRRFNLTFSTDAVGIDSASVYIETRIRKHPLLYFSNFSEDITAATHDHAEPWLTWKNTLNITASWNGSYPEYAAIMYHRNNFDTKYSDAAITWLNNFTRTPGDGYNNGSTLRITELEKITLIYDCIYGQLNETEDITARNKIAELADQLFYDTNHSATGDFGSYISTVDYHLKMYPVLGVVGMLLSDYDNDSLPHGSTPEDWINCGTEYLFVNDTLHIYNRSMISFQLNNEGKEMMSSYKTYYYINFLYLFNAYYEHYGQNITSVYPIANKWVTADLWNALPNRYDSNHGTGGNHKWLQHRFFINLIDSVNGTYMKNFYEILLADNTIPNAYLANPPAAGQYQWAYLFLENTSAVSQANPTWTSKISKDSTFQLMRSDWTNRSSWLSFITFNYTANANRIMEHQDQLSFDYYSKGDYLMADSGEVKYRESGYGPEYAKGHNIIMVSNSSNGNLGGIVKGTSGTLYKGAPLDFSITGNSFEFTEAAVMNWDTIETCDSKGEPTSGSTTLANSVGWRRSILYPGKEYFVVLDFVNNSQQREIQNLFHLTSFKSNASIDGVQNGSVYGNLTIDGSYVAWNSQAYNQEVDITNASELKWNTSNAYNESLQTYLFSVPESEISVEKFWTRIGGYFLASEVDGPLIRFKDNRSDSLYRITTFNTRHVTDPEWNISNITVSGGNGNAMNITNGTWVDFITHSNGSKITAGHVETDSSYSVYRDDSGVKWIFARDVEQHNISETPHITSNESLAYVLLVHNGTNATVTLDGQDNTYLEVRVPCNNNTNMSKDGILQTFDVDYGCVDTNNLWAIVDFNSQIVLEIRQGVDAGDVTPPSVEAYYQWNSTNATLDFGTWTDEYVSINWNLTDSTGINTSTCQIKVRNRNYVDDILVYSYINESIHPDYDPVTGYKNLTCYTEDLGGGVIKAWANMTRSYDWLPMITAFDQDSAAHDNTYSNFGGKSTKICFNNISNFINMTFIFMADISSQASTVADHLFYSSNSSYTSGDYTTSPNCNFVGAITTNASRDPTFNYVIGALTTDENGTYGGVGYTESMCGISYCPSCTNANNAWITHSTTGYDGHSATSANQGTQWTNLTGEEFNVILYAVNNDQLEFNLTIDDTIGNQLSDLQVDIYGAPTNLAPFGDLQTDSIIGGLTSYYDIHNITEKGTIWVNTTVSDPNLDNVSCSLFLLNNDSSFNKTLYANYSICCGYGTFPYEWDTTTVSDGDYRLNVTCFDGSLTGYDESSGYIRIGNAKPSIEYVFPTESNGSTISKNYTFVNVTVTDALNTSAFIDWNNTLVGWWNFEHALINGTVWDNSSWLNHGTLMNHSSNTTVTGKYGQGYTFDGVNDVIVCDDDNSLHPGSEDFSVEVWVYTNYTGSQDIIKKRRTTMGIYYPGWLIQQSLDGQVRGRMEWSTGYRTLLSTQTINDSSWHHIVLSRDASINELRLYVDGLLSVNATYATGNITTTHDLLIGKGFNGSIDEVRIHGRTLSPDEINASFNNNAYRLSNNFTDLDGIVYTHRVGAINTNGNLNWSETRTISVNLDLDTNFTIWNGSTYIDALDDYVSFLCRMPSTDCEPINQNASSSQCITKVCNNGTATAGSIRMRLNSTCTNITFFVDDDTTAAGATVIDTSWYIIHDTLAVGACIDVCWWANYSSQVPPCTVYPEPEVVAYG